MNETVKITQKTCTKCEDTLPIEYFYPDPTRKDGYRNICKTCLSSYPAYKQGFKGRGHVDKTELTGKTKTCSKCRKKKDRAYFSADKSKVDGLRTACKECRKKDWQDYQNKRKAEAQKLAAEKCRAAGGHFWNEPFPGDRNICTKCGHKGQVFEPASTLTERQG